MIADWQSDFSYSYFRRILRAIEGNFKPCLIGDATRALKLARREPVLFLRHDVDIDPNRAMRMAEIEDEFGICATYMFMVGSPLYRPEDSVVRSIIRRLIWMGHEIALHFDLGVHRVGYRAREPDSVEKQIVKECMQLEDIISIPVRSLSFHRPLPQFLHGPLFVAERVNAYARELMATYLSDSRGRWREGEPLPRLLKPNCTLLQLLIHPIWWGDQHMSPEARLEAFFQEAIQGFSEDEIKVFDDSLASTLGIRRVGAEAQESN